MDRTAIIMRIAALLIAAGVTLAVLEFWGVAAGIMGNYFSEVSAPKDTGVITVRVLPPPDQAPPNQSPRNQPPPKSPPPK